jgi:hypothetical protein
MLYTITFSWIFKKKIRMHVLGSLPALAALNTSLSKMLTIPWM